MTDVSTSAAYVRKGEFADQPAQRVSDMRGAVIEEQVWALLKTPQTVESLRRAVSGPQTVPMQSRSQLHRKNVEAAARCGPNRTFARLVSDVI